MASPDYHFCVAPMIDWTDRHCRYFHRLICPRARLYTEMITAEAIIHGDAARLLRFNEEEHPVALQLGGGDPRKLGAAAALGADHGYDEINLNLGCPSDRVQSGKFGACMMLEPSLVAECYAAMAEAASIPVTVKCRIGVDDQIPEDTLPDFIEKLAAAGCEVFIIHARKAWLKGLSPKQNRTVPPLDYALAATIKERFADLTIIINGGVTTMAQVNAHLETFDGVMLGRAAYENPYLLAEASAHLFDEKAPSRIKIAQAMMAYAEQAMAGRLPVDARVVDTRVNDARVNDVRPLRINAVTRHMLGLFHGQPGARLWRRTLTEQSARPGADARIIERALAAMAPAARASEYV